MKKYILPLLVLVVLIGGIVATLFLVKQRQDLRKSAAPATTATLTPSASTININDTVDIKFDVNTNANGITAAELHINFDPTVFQGMSFTKGTIFNSEIVAGTVGNGTASIILGLTSTTGQLAQPFRGQGTLATLKLKAIKAAAGSAITIDNGTQIAATQEGGNVISTKTDTSVTVTADNNGVTLTPTPTPSATTTPSLTGTTTTPSPTGTTITPSPTGSTNPTATPTPTRTPTPTGSGGVGGATSTPSPTPIPSTTLSVSNLTNGQTIDNALPTFSGTAAPNSKVIVTIQSNPQTITTYANASGQWSVKAQTPLETGTHTLIVTAQDSTGKTATQSIGFSVGTLPKTASIAPAILLSLLGFALLALGSLRFAL